ncbi:response regulator [Sphingomonas oligophenolica]|uniref:Response regulator n=1 Tax=Sphingomonas oligophenolica TaxID=301154 RepID=A0A502CFW5_9SPHN|nr:response regulator [Sphingomonas oligophenolica]TPG12615.1 response regulator [Sphingomonas oligophenolica]
MTGLLAGRQMLVVEDEMLVLMNIEMAFEDLGCSQIHAAASVAEALALLGSHDFDAAFLDVNLGGEKSYPIADALAQRGIPFVFSTGYRDHGDRPDLEDRPALRKPYTREALIAVLERLLPDEPLPVAA